MEEESQVEIPCYFLCPISMQLMKDPVTVSTGITYDRENIEKWLFSCKNTTCPVTKQPLIPAADLTPNHTLRRLIQAWCTLNAHDRIPTPKPSFHKSQILNLLDQAKKSPTSLLHCLQRLRSIAHENESCRNHLQAAPGTAAFLLSVVGGDDAAARDEAFSILQEMELSDSDLNSFFTDDSKILNALIKVLQSGDSQSRSRAATLVNAAFVAADPIHLIGSGREVFVEAVRVLEDRISPQATKEALKLLVELCRWGKNRLKAVEAGAVAALVELLLDAAADRRTCELGLTALDQLCGCADGRAELLRHGAGLAVVSKKILRVSGVASDRAVRILGSIARYSANARVLQEMVQVGVVSKLCLAVQIEGNQKTKERIREILRLHSRVWKEYSSCIPTHLLSSYPS